MKNIKKVLSLLLVLLIVYVVSGCGEKKDPTLESIKVDSTTIPTSIKNTEVDSEITKIKIILLYSDKSEKTENLTKDMISEDDYNKLSSAGTYEITITYETKTTSLSLTITSENIVNPPVEKTITYTVYIEDIAQKPLANFYVTFYSGSKIAAEGYTKTDGKFSSELKADKYEVIIEGRDEYYLNQERFEIDANNPELSIVSEINDLDGIEADPTEHRYEEGDVMYDFTITDIDGNELRLYELLETKKAVILNFWYTTCSACNSEFPYLVEAYESTYVDAQGETINYSDEIAIIAINPGIAGNGDSLTDVKNYRDSMGLSFNVAMDIDYDKTNQTMDPALHDMFNVTAYPTTVIVDQYGLIAELAVGAVVGTEKWTQEFDKYLAENYTPKYEPETEEDGGLKVPPEDLEFPSSADISNAINGTNYDGTKFETTYTAGDETYAWPWIIDTYDGKSVIKPSNSFENFSYSMIYLSVNLKKGEAFVFDYFSSTEVYDELSVIVENTVATTISGVDTEWGKCYGFVAVEDGTYEISLCYLKDKTYSSGDDAVYVTNFRIEKEDSIDKETYIFRNCATGEINEITMRYANYVKVVYNENDGYYHVDNANGPLLLANLLASSKWNNNPVYDLTLENLCIGFDGVDYNDIIVDYSVYAANSIAGYTVVTEELANALKQVTKALGDEAAQDNENQWLEVCVYYSAYGTGGVQFANPNTGVSPFEPIVFEGDGINEPAKAEATFTKVIMPRGMYFAFTASKNGVYRFYSTSSFEAEGWVCDKDGNVLADSDEGLRIFAEKITKGEKVDGNFVAYVYLEAGQTYLFVGAFYDLYEFSTLTVEMAYDTDKIELLTIASPGVFTTSDESMTQIISGDYVEVELGADGYYHVKGSKATDDRVYCDIKYVNNITDVSIENLLNKYSAFDFSKDEYGQVMFDENGYYLTSFLNDDNELIVYYVCYDADGEEYYVETIGQDGYTEENGYTYLRFTEEEIAALKKKDYTEYVKNYLNEHLVTDEESELYGCVLVDEEFADVLQLFMGKYTFAGIDYSWLKLCYYYKYVGPINAE